MSWIDIHTHLNFLEITAEEALEKAKQEGVDQVITIGTCPKDWDVVLDLAQKNHPQVHGTLGVHPHDAKDYTPEARGFLEKHLDDPYVVAVGEIGLDYYYDHSPREQQKKVFRELLELSVQKGMPVQIHTRDAEEDTIEILKEFNGQIKGLIHCFTGTQWLADEALKLGLNISFSGIVTFKKADDLREVVKSVPMDRLHVETDSPFLTPVPFRGKKNEPSYLPNTAKLIAELKDVDLNELSKQTNENAKNIFTKMVI